MSRQKFFSTFEAFIQIWPEDVLQGCGETLFRTKYYLLTYFAPFVQWSLGPRHQLSGLPPPRRENKARKIRATDRAEYCIKI